MKIRKRDKEKAGAKKKRTSNAWVLSVSISILALVFITVPLLAKRDTVQAEGEDIPIVSNRQVTESTAELLQKELGETLFSQSRHIKGDISAPVTIIEFSDFQ